jgi:hypothetical protein
MASFLQRIGNIFTAKHGHETRQHANTRNLTSNSMKVSNNQQELGRPSLDYFNTIVDCTKDDDLFARRPIDELDNPCIPSPLAPRSPMSQKYTPEKNKSSATKSRTERESEMPLNYARVVNASHMRSRSIEPQIQTKLTKSLFHEVTAAEMPLRRLRETQVSRVAVSQSDKLKIPTHSRRRDSRWLFEYQTNTRLNMDSFQSSVVTEPMTPISIRPTATEESSLGRSSKSLSTRNHAFVIAKDMNSRNSKSNGSMKPLTDAVNEIRMSKDLSQRKAKSIALPDVARFNLQPERIGAERQPTTKHHQPPTTFYSATWPVDHHLSSSAKDAAQCVDKDNRRLRPNLSQATFANSLDPVISHQRYRFSSNVRNFPVRHSDSTIPSAPVKEDQSGRSSNKIPGFQVRYSDSNIPSVPVKEDQSGRSSNKIPGFQVRYSDSNILSVPVKVDHSGRSSNKIPDFQVRYSDSNIPSAPVTSYQPYRSSGNIPGVQLRYSDSNVPLDPVKVDDHSDRSRSNVTGFQARYSDSLCHCSSTTAPHYEEQRRILEYPENRRLWTRQFMYKHPSSFDEHHQSEMLISQFKAIRCRSKSRRQNLNARLNEAHQRIPVNTFVSEPKASKGPQKRVRFCFDS